MGSKESGTVHYLKNVREAVVPPSEPPPAPYTELIRHLEERINRIEKEVKGRVFDLEKREISKEGAREFTSLIQGLEAKVQRISDEIRSELVARKKSASYGVTENLSRLRRGISLHGLKKIFSNLWFGTGEESYDVDEFGLDPAFQRKVKPFFDFLYYNYWRVTARGLQNIPAQGRGLIVANHSGTLPYDGTMIGLSIMNEHPSRKDVRFLVEDFVYHFPFLGTFMYRVGGVRACPENAERLLSKDHLVSVFPEGVKGIGKHYKNRYRLQRFGRGGFIKLALRMDAPLIPAAVIGAEEIHPLLYKSTVLARPLGIPYLPITPTLPLLGLLGLIPLPSKWTIVFGAPIQFSPRYGPKDADDQLLVNRLSEEVRAKIQEMVMEALKSRRSIWFS